MHLIIEDDVPGSAALSLTVSPWLKQKHSIKLVKGSSCGELNYDVCPTEILLSINNDKRLCVTILIKTFHKEVCVFVFLEVNTCIKTHWQIYRLGLCATVKIHVTVTIQTAS